MKYLLLAGLFTILSVAPIPAQQLSARIAFDFRGLKMGDEAPLDAKHYCLDVQRGEFDQTCIEEDDIAGVSVQIRYIYVYARQLGGLTITYPPEDYKQILAAFTAKYGKPHKVKTEALQTRLGTRYTNEIALWYTDSGVLRVQRYGSMVDQGLTSIFSPSYLQEVKDRKRDAAAKAAQDEL